MIRIRSVQIEKARPGAVVPQLRPLRVLLRAYHAAQYAGRPPRDFAVELADFRALGVPSSELRLLLSYGHIEHLLDVTPPRSCQRRCRQTTGLAFKANSCFVLTESGVRCAIDRYLWGRQKPGPVRGKATTIDTIDARSRVPRWDGQTRELWLGGLLVRRFLTKADNQTRVLAAFQEQGWPPRIDDPLPPKGTRDRRRKLHDAIRKLNQHQLQRTLRFRRDGTGEGVCWSMANGARASHQASPE